jgi:hypothetical protein
MSHVTARRRAFACACLATIMAGCSAQSRSSDDPPPIYYDLGDAWKTPKRSVRLYDCRTGSMVCTGPASYLNVTLECRCE